MAAFAVAETEYQWAPLRIFDLRPGLEGKVQAITQPIAVWNADWNDLAHNHEVRWPYVFVSAYEDGLQVFNMQDPKHPKTMGWYYTCECTHETGFGGLPDWQGTSIYNGAFGVMVRNADGLIMITDSNTGAWLFKMDGFSGWNGEDWCDAEYLERAGLGSRTARLEPPGGSAGAQGGREITAAAAGPATAPARHCVGETERPAAEHRGRLLCVAMWEPVASLEVRGRVVCHGALRGSG